MSAQKKNRVTIKDVAQLAGVAPSTVSFVLNNAKEQKISEETRIRVLRCVQQLGYRPNHSASSICSGSARTIGVITSYRMHSLYFLDLITGVTEAAHQANYGVVICPGPQPDDDFPFLRYFLEGRIDGVVFISSAHSEEKSRECDYISLFRKHNIPFSVVYGYTNFPGVCYANTNFYEDGRKACQLLLERGCKRVGYIGALDKDNQSLYMPQTERDRMNGYISALSEADMSQHVLHLPRDFHAVDYPALCRAIQDLDADGLVTCWATYGLQLLSVLQDLGKRVPEDVRVIALDSLPYLDYTTPPLSAMRMPFYEMAREGTHMLLAQLQHTPVELQHNQFGAIMELRAST